jgi:hypothetical protein
MTSARVVGVAALLVAAGVAMPSALATATRSHSAGNFFAPAAAASIDRAGPQWLSGTSLTMVGDLNGDGRRDLVDFRTVQRGDRTLRYSVTARDGLTGKALWHHVVAEPHGGLFAGSFAAAEPIVVGAPGRPGILLIHNEDVSHGATDQTSLRLTAWSGETGAKVWSRVLTGSSTTSGQEIGAAAVPALIGVFHDVRGRSEDVLVSEATDNGVDNETVTPVVVSGRDGSLTTRPSITAPTESVAAVGQPGLVDLAVEPDLSGDGLDDILAIAPGLGQSAGSFHNVGFTRAIAGNTGKTIWTSHDSRLYGALDGVESVQIAGAVSGGRVPDLVVVAARDKAYAARSLWFTLVRGRDGKVLWRKAATSDNILGKAGKHLRGAVGLIDQPGYDHKNGRTIDQFTTLAYRANGRQIYRKTYRLSVKTIPHAKPRFGGYDFELGPFDIQPDGSADFGVAMTAHSGTNDRHRDGVISGRYGNFIPLPFGDPADGSLRHGKGTDIVRTSEPTGQLVMAGFSSRTGDRYFTTSLRRPNQTTLEVTGARVTGHPCSDLVVDMDQSVILSSDHYPVTEAVISGSGHLLWTLRFRANRALGGALVDQTPPKRFCA